MRVVGAFLLIALIIAIGAGAYYGWVMKSDVGDERGGPGRQPQLVTVAPVGMREFVDQIEAVGTAKGKESIDLTAKSVDTIGAINFSDGQKVPAGFVVAEMTRREQSADVIAAKADLAEAEKAYQRFKQLSEKGFATNAQLEAALSKRDSAQARLNAMQSRVTDRRSTRRSRASWVCAGQRRDLGETRRHDHHARRRHHHQARLHGAGDLLGSLSSACRSGRALRPMRTASSTARSPRSTRASIRCACVAMRANRQR